MRVQDQKVTNRAILLDDSHKLDSRPLDKGQRPKSWQIQAKTYMAPHFGGKINWFKPKTK
jgi:hypothetical protein